MPHLLVLVFTTNDQSVEGGLRVVAAAQRERGEFGYDRGPLVVIPLLSRWEGESEVDIGEQWMNRFDTDLAPLTASWLPRDFSPRQFLEKTRIPHVPRFTFGEPLPVLTHSLADPGLPGLYFDTIARLIRLHLRNVGTVIDAAYNEKQDAVPTSSRLFISYRRVDSSGAAAAGRVYDRLEREFGRELLWMDVDAIPVGVNFVKVLEEEVAKCDVLLAVIGQDWVDARDDDGQRRLDNPHDYVRIEIAAALKRDIPVIPILVDGARIPKPDQLPDDLKDLALRNGLDIRHGSFHSDMDMLIHYLRIQPAQQTAQVTTSVARLRAEMAKRRKAEESEAQRQADERKRAEEAEVGQRAGVEQRRKAAKAAQPQRAWLIAGGAVGVAAVVALVLVLQLIEQPTVAPVASQVVALSLDRERALKPKDTFRECSECPEIMVVPAGSFTMGSPGGEKGRYSNESPQHQVTFARPFAVGKFAVTFYEWDACVVLRPGFETPG
jgi:hypothetical protein